MFVTFINYCLFHFQSKYDKLVQKYLQWRNIP